MIELSGAKMATMISFLRAHKRVITFSLVAFGAFWLTPSWSEVGPFDFLSFFALFVMLIVSQIFWVGRGQLYVNSGIGTTGTPIRLGARPEITVLELTRT
jgi:hypothetical protein